MVQSDVICLAAVSFGAVWFKWCHLLLMSHWHLPT